METSAGKVINYTSGYAYKFAQQGWQCPICGKVLAPFVPECPCQGQGGVQTITTTKNTDINDK